jgi:hypothetical protein
MSTAERVRKHRERKREQERIAEKYLGPVPSPEQRRALARKWGWRLDDPGSTM